MNKKFTVAEFDNLIVGLQEANVSMKDARKLELIAWYKFYTEFAKIPNSQDTTKNRLEAKVMKDVKITEKRFKNIISVLKVSIEKGLKPLKFRSINDLENAKKELAKGNKKVGKTGTAVADTKGMAQNEAKMQEIKAVNDTELLELLESADFKAFKKVYEAKGWKLQTIMKGLKAES